MAGKTDVLLLGSARGTVVEGLAARFTLHRMVDARDAEALVAELAPRLRAIAVSDFTGVVDSAMMARLPKLEIVSTWGVGYDHIDAKWAGAHGIVVTHTPDVLNEEVADTALGL